MAKMMLAVVDTECVGLQDKSVYDFAWQIVDKKGNVYSEGSYLVEETIIDADKMMGAFYAKKIFSHYIPMLAKGIITIKPWKDIRSEFLADLDKFNVDVFAAYNVGFDMGAIKSTNGEGKFLHRPMRVLDIWQFACETILSSKTYMQLAREQNWVSDAGNIRTNAEKAYSYISADWNYIEEHTALEDVKIENKILAACFRQKKKIPFGKVNAQPWRIVNEN
jgi:hypothetical protein